MRIQFEISKQKELIATFKKDYNFTWDSFSKFLGVNKGALLMWYYEKNLLPSFVYDKIDSNGSYKKYILKVHENNWGLSKGGYNSYGSTKKIIKPGFSSRLAELVGIILGDGNIHEFKKSKKVRSYMVRIAGDASKDRAYLSNYVSNLFKSQFGINTKLYYSKRNNAMFLLLHSKELVYFFKEIGLEKGDKLQTQVTIPYWILRDESYTKACLRGLIDTDGSIHRMSRKDPNLLRITFTNYNHKLLITARTAFISLGFHPSKIICNKNIYLSRKNEIVRYINEIGFSNDKHKNRLKRFTAP